MATVRARTQTATQSTGRFISCYIDLDPSNTYGVFLMYSNDYGVTWSAPVTIQTGVATTTFYIVNDSLDRLWIYYSKIVGGAIKLFYKTTIDLGVTLSAEVEVV